MDVEVAFVAVPVSALGRGQEYFERMFGRPPDIVPNELCVADLDATLAELAGRGLTPTTVEEVGTAGRKATFADADGNTVALIEVRS